MTQGGQWKGHDHDPSTCPGCRAGEAGMGKRRAVDLPRRYARARRLAELYDISVSTIWRRAKDGTFPKPYRLGPNTVAWDLDEVEAAIGRPGGAA